VDVVEAVVEGAAVRQHRDPEAGRMTETRMTGGRMIDQMDRAILALQAAFTARKLYGLDHAVVKKQVDLASETFASLLAARRELRVVRIESALLFDDADLPSCVHLAEVLTPCLASHRVEWLEFRAGLARAELVTLLEQLERAPADAARIGTTHVRVGRLGRNDADDGDADALFESADTVSTFRQIWGGLGGGGGDGEGGPGAGPGGRPDQKLSDLVESIRLAVAVGSDVCKQLAEVKSHDEYTFVHTVNVAILSAALGEAVGMKPSQVFDLTLAALLHDVGKQRTPLAILNKPGKLDDAERKQMELHTTAGAAMLMVRQGVPDVAPVVAFEHHANVDGTGYPRLTRHGRPHLASQIVHVADVFDALRTHRPYRAALEDAKVRSILTDGSGKQFDAALLNLFLDRVVTPREAGPRKLSA
jgi:putative nucleotidyltransferase with HDIG domain